MCVKSENQEGREKEVERGPSARPFWTFFFCFRRGQTFGGRTMFRLVQMQNLKKITGFVSHGLCAVKEIRAEQMV